MKKLRLSEERAKALYKDASQVERAILEDTFGIEALIKKGESFVCIYPRPQGVWCLTKDHRAFKAADIEVKWDRDDLLGVGVVTEDLAFIVHPGPSVVLPWGNPDTSIDAPALFDTDSVDFETATRAIVAAHEGVKTKWCDDDRFEYVGAPAAQWCRDLPGGNWHLPTLRVLKSMSEHIGQINECLRAFGCHIVGPGYHWSSTAKKDAPRCAFVVLMNDGSVCYSHMLTYYCLRAVSAFHFEDFKF
ncbi:hypothetical protein [uncultured Alistipes sp.]|uniref:hypothetical protein n=1 Tax=uncultured Alistipes sp. TaxID=538949 RepID=UPI002638715E|nr:hypothetical protein [uncultured Alistipes sp.]